MEGGCYRVRLSIDSFVNNARKFKLFAQHVFCFSNKYGLFVGGAVAQWLRFCATNRKVAGWIPAGVIRMFH